MQIGVPFAHGYDPRRHVPRMSPAEREFREAVEANHIPKADALLTAMLAAGMNGDVKAAELFFKVCGLIQPPTNNAKIQETAKALLDGMIAEARERRRAP